MSRKNGFTLIELLVVIAIIAILAAILFPVFMSAKAASQRSMCAANLGQIGMAMRMYMDDNNEILPPPMIGGSYDEINQTALYYWPTSTWRLEIDPYVKNNGVFSCPTRGLASNASILNNSGDWRRFRWGHYGLNPNYVNHPSEKFINQKALLVGEIVDVWHRGSYGAGMCYMNGDICDTLDEEFQYTSTIHDGFVSYVAMDGSAHTVHVLKKIGLSGSRLMYLRPNAPY